MLDQPIIRVNDLTKKFRIRGNIFKKEEFYALDGVSFEIYANEIVGLIGESGCGKSTLGKIITKLTNPSSGSIEFKQANITDMKSSDFSALRHKIQMIFQDPNGILNPSFKINMILHECLKTKGMKSKELRTKTIKDTIEKVGLNTSYLYRYPHELSGGQKQRVSILLALFMEPEIIVADEVVSALDVSVRSQILNLLKELQKTTQMAYLFISHDLNVVYHISDRIIVMYLGQIVEQGTAETIYHHHFHPYTNMLFESTLDREQNNHSSAVNGEALSSELINEACKFYNRCSHRKELCRISKPELKEIEPNHFVRCHLTDLGEQCS